MGSKSKKSKNNQKAEPSNDTAGAAAVTGNKFGKTAITDSRFSHAQSDPKFAGHRKDKEKVAIDDRFRHAFTDKRFAVSNAPIDKRGKRKKGAAENDLKRHYRLEEEEEEEIEERKRKRKRKRKQVLAAVEEEDEESDEKESESDEELKKPAVKSSDLELEKESDSSDEDDEEEDEDEGEEEPSSDTTDSEEDEVYSEEEDTFVQEEDVPEIDKETRRLAVVNLDWSNVKAVDLFVLLSSFLPKEGIIESVAVYPSEFGLQRMEEEAAKGPVGLFDDEKEPEDGDENEDDDDDGEIDNKKLRAYELSRMKYYYAVVTCDSINTSDHLYKTCDGVEFERSSNKLDLRFIPDSMEFKHPPRDIAKEAPAKYEGVDFHSRALQHSNIQLTWDEDEPQRAHTLKRNFNPDQLADLELKDFLASDDSETDEEDETLENGTEKKPTKQDRYRALLQSGEGSDEDDEEGGQDMEVTFNTDLENLSKRVLEKKDKQSETVWEAHLRKMKEKKKARRNRSKNSSDDESSESDGEPREEIDDFFLEEPSSKKGARNKSDSKSKKHQETDKEAEASRAELELLLADDNGADPNLKGYNMKPKKAKGKKGKEIPEEGKIPTADLEDERFSRIFTSHLYALDPTDPQFKRSATYARQLQRKGGRREDSEPEARKPTELPADDLETSKDDHSGPAATSKDREKHEISSLVKSIKMKSKQVQVAPSKVKTSRKK